MTIGFSLNILEDFINYGDEIGVFDSTNKLVGSSIFTNENMAITVWGNDVYSIEKYKNCDGEVVFEKYPNQTFTALDVSSFSSNLYTINVMYGKSQIIEKLLIQH